jgi:putative endonuclease
MQGAQSRPGVGNRGLGVVKDGNKFLFRHPTPDSLPPVSNAAATKLPRNAADGLFTKPSKMLPNHCAVTWRVRHSRESGNPGRAAVEKSPCVYILASRRNGTLYIGLTSDLVKRIWQHKNEEVEGFTKSYRVHDLVWYELHETMDGAIKREKAMKKWNRAWKIALIEKSNLDWKDLFSDLI